SDRRAHPLKSAGEMSKSPDEPSCVNPLALLISLMRAPLVTLALLGAAVCADAASLTVTVVDNAGKPLPDAVVMLEPTGSKLPVKPMAAVDVSQSKRRFVPQ